MYSRKNNNHIYTTTVARKIDVHFTIIVCVQNTLTSMIFVVATLKLVGSGHMPNSCWHELTTSSSYTRKNATDLLQPVAPSGLIQVWYHSCIRLLSLQTVQNWRYQAGTGCWFVSAVSVWCNRMIQVCWEQTVAVCNRHDGPTALMEAVGIR